eukprot:3348198-Prymnesium_polylepis.1
MHGATVPRRSIPIGAAFALPIAPARRRSRRLGCRAARPRVRMHGRCTGIQSRRAKKIATVSRLPPPLERV